jgi:hypothetical protein
VAQVQATGLTLAKLDTEDARQDVDVVTLS